jgi:hypothetical protein
MLAGMGCSCLQRMADQGTPGPVHTLQGKQYLRAVLVKHPVADSGHDEGTMLPCIPNQGSLEALHQSIASTVIALHNELPAASPIRVL